MTEEMKSLTDAVEENRNDVVIQSMVEGSNAEETKNRGPSLMDEDEVITFSRRFPKRIETQLQKDWPMLKTKLKDYGIACELNPVKHSLTFSTTRTRNTDLIGKARDLLRFLTLAVPASQAMTILKSVWRWDVFKLGFQKDGLCTKFGINKEKFNERRKLLCHPSLKEIGDIFLSDIYMDGDILVALGPVSSLKVVRLTVEDCIVRGIPPASRVKLVKDMEVHVKTTRRLEALLL